MKNKIVFVFITLILFVFPNSFGYAYGGSNMGYYYPSFSRYLSYDPSAEELGRYIDEVKQSDFKF